MELRIMFHGGPLDNKAGRCNRLDNRQIFLKPNDRQILVYVRHNEVEYVFDPVLSDRMSKEYDLSVSNLIEQHRYSPPPRIVIEDKT